MLTEITKIAIVDELPLFRELLKNYLSEQSDVKVLAQASDIFELLDKLTHLSIDVLVLNAFIPDPDISGILKIIQDRYPNIKILVLSACTDPQVISELLDFGIHGYISKTEAPEDLLRAITAASGNSIYRSKLLTEALYYNKKHNAKNGTNGVSLVLNEREKKILQMLWEEKSNKEIADQLFLSVRSIEKIRQDMKEKLGIKSTVGLLKYGIIKKIIGHTNLTP
jgi:DNA-binding NarL/FixJ family response regulator